MKYPPGASIRAPDRTYPLPGFRRWAGEYLREARKIDAAEQDYPAFLPAFAVFLVFLLTLILSAAGARAQSGIMANGDLAVTGFSGTRDVGGQAFIDTDGASLKVYDTSGKGSPSAQVINAPVKYQALARDIGQVFGVALDNAPNPNIYATSTSVHGLQIVIPDNNGDGVPERVNTGQPGAMFMDGQFGTALGGGPGTVWRIDGTTGEITKFADITFGGIPNSGPGLGNIAFDPAHFQFYVSDLDTGAIHRLDLSGNVIGVFDHGVDGRQAAGFPAVAMNAGNKMDITSLAFDSTNPDTWGLADPKRRVWGLAYFKERLYYAVTEGSQIWSVGINADGSFAADARVEINAVPGGKAVSDILFTPQGRMVLAQRGGILSAADYTQYHTPKQNSVLRYTRDLDGNWIQEPDEYAIGFPVDHKNASGGVGLACDGTLWSTADALANDPAVVVHGLQGNDVNHVRPLNVPPWSSWFVDYKNGAGQETEAGHVGDVEVYRNCPGGYTESFPGWYPIPDWVPHDDWVPPVWWPRDPDLDIEKYGKDCEYFGGDWYICDYTIVVRNIGAADYIGHLNVTDNPPAGAIYLAPPGGSIPWNCAQPGGAGAQILCDSVNVENLHPGEAETLDIRIAVPVADHDEYIRNCAIVDDPFDFWPNEDCDRTEIPRPDLEIKKGFLQCIPEGANKRCYFVISFQNVGGAPYSGPLHFLEDFPAGTLFGGIHATTTPGWGCVGGSPVSCTLPDPPGVTMNPGDYEGLVISVLVPAGVGGDMKNCVRLGEPTHADDPHAPGKNKDCVPFTVPLPIKHECPDGWTEVPPGGAPPGHLVIAIDGINPDGTGWGIMCMKPKPEEKAAAPRHDPEPPVKTPPVVHKCPSGWTKVPPQGAPNGYQVVILDGINPDGSKWGIKCMRPRPRQPQHRCPSGWTKVPPQGLPAGYRMMILDGVNPDGSRWGLKCMKPKPDEQTGPTCRPGEKLYTSARYVPKGWKARKVIRGNTTIWCAKPGTFIPPKPRCKGGKLVMLKTLPPRWKCICPQRTKLVNGVCKPDYPRSTPEIKPCRKGWKRVHGKCIPPVLCKKGWRKVHGKCLPPLRKPRPVICKKGWRKVNGKCLPPLRKPRPVICKKGWRKVNGKCLPPLRKPRPVICKKGWRKVHGRCLPPLRKPKPRVTPEIRKTPSRQIKPRKQLKLKPQLQLKRNFKLKTFGSRNQLR